MRRTYHLPLLLAGQLAFLLVGFGSEVWQGRQRSATTFEDLIIGLIAGHTLLLGVFAWCFNTARREQQIRAAALNKQLSQALRKADDLIECSSDMVWETDAFGRFTFVSDHNGVMGKNWGVRVGMLVTDLADLDPVTDREAWKRQIESNMRSEPFRDFHYSLRRPDGTIAYFCVNGIPIRTEAGELAGFRGTTRDQTAEIEALQILNHQVMHDALTGLPNRRYLLTTLDDLSTFPEPRIALLLLDLDGFKVINDRYGHAVGDQLLRLVAGRLGEIIRSADFACRLGGDEFVIVLSGATTSDARLLAQRVIDALAAPFLIEAVAVRVGASVGIALAPDHGPVSSLLLSLADHALYEVKRIGGSGLRIYQGLASADAITDVPVNTLHSPVVREVR